MACLEGHVLDCKASTPGSNPGGASNFSEQKHLSRTLTRAAGRPKRSDVALTSPYRLSAIWLALSTRNLRTCSSGATRNCWPVVAKTPTRRSLTLSLGNRDDLMSVRSEMASWLNVAVGKRIDVSSPNSSLFGSLTAWRPSGGMATQFFVFLMPRSRHHPMPATTALRPWFTTRI